MVPVGGRPTVSLQAPFGRLWAAPCTGAARRGRVRYGMYPTSHGGGSGPPSGGIPGGTNYDYPAAAAEAERPVGPPCPEFSRARTSASLRADAIRAIQATLVASGDAVAAVASVACAAAAAAEAAASSATAEITASRAADELGKLMMDSFLSPAGGSLSADARSVATFARLAGPAVTDASHPNTSPDGSAVPSAAGAAERAAAAAAIAVRAAQVAMPPASSSGTLSEEARVATAGAASSACAPEKPGGAASAGAACVCQTSASLAKERVVRRLFYTPAEGHASPATTVTSPSVKALRGMASADPRGGEIAGAGSGGDGWGSAAAPVEAVVSFKGGFPAGQAMANDMQASANFPSDKVEESAPLGRNSSDE